MGAVSLQVIQKQQIILGTEVLNAALCSSSAPHFVSSTEMCLSMKLRMRGSYQCCSQAIGPEQKGFADGLSCVRPTSSWFD